jgi:hypothetical protein
MDEKAFGCVGSTIRLASGRYLDLAEPDPAVITIEDIAAGLSKLCRFGGQISRFYSVAEHSLACVWLATMRGYSAPVKRACLIDRTMLIAERRTLFSADNVTWAGEGDVERIDFTPRGWLPDEAEDEFLEEAERLGVLRGN